MPDETPLPPRLVRDLMTVGVPTCPPETPAADIARLLLDRDLEALVVLNAEGHAIGVVTRTELVTAFARGRSGEIFAEAIMNPDIPELPPDIPLEAAVNLMLDSGQRIAFLSHHGGGVRYPSAMITFTHIMRVLAARNADELRDLGVSAKRESPIETFIKKRDAALRDVNGSPEE
jgi:CBS domain-containing protein